jgi:hypothetical protein
VKATRLIFVYNADSGLFNAAFDALHKVVSPRTYACDLCRLTYGPTRMKKEWKRTLEELPLETAFYHRDEFRARYDRDDALPAVFVERDRLEVLLSAEELGRLSSLEELRLRLREKVAAVRDRPGGPASPPRISEV